MWERRNESNVVDLFLNGHIFVIHVIKRFI